MKRIAILFSISLLGLGIGGCGSSDSDAPGRDVELQHAREDFSPVLAEVDDVKITQSYFDYRYEHLPPAEKVRYTGEGWEERFLDKLIEETVVYLQAQEEGFQNQREVEYRLDMANRSILYKAFYEHYFKDNLVIPEEEARAYYEEGKEAFQSLPSCLGYHIQTSSKEKIEEAAEALDEGMTFSKVARDFSEDENTREDGGLLGWFNPDGYVLGMGFNKEFTDYAFSMGPRQVSDPVKIGDNWHIIRTGNILEGDTQSFEEARETIERQLRPTIARESFQNRVRELKKKFGVDYRGEFGDRETRSAEQLYRLAAESRDPRSRLHYYELLVENHPDDERADEALFMKGFIHSEEFGEMALATRAFRQLEQRYPDSEWIESAKWLAKHGARSVPSLRGDRLPADANEAGDRIDDARG